MCNALSLAGKRDPRGKHLRCSGQCGHLTKPDSATAFLVYGFHLPAVFFQIHLQCAEKIKKTATLDCELVKACFV